MPFPLRALARSSAALLTMALGACYTSIGKWTYPSGRYATTTSERPAKALVVVEPLLDQRGTYNVSSMFWSYVPLFPLGWLHFDRPEATVHDPDTTEYTANPCDDLPRAIVIEMHRQRLVDQAVFAADYRRVPGETHRLRGVLRAYSVAQTRWTYGLSIYGAAAWALALPIGVSKNAFCVDLELRDAATGRAVWVATVFDADDWLEGYYYGPEWYRFPWLWERRLRERLGEVATVLGAAPAPLPPELQKELAEFPPRMPEELRPPPAQ